MKENEVMVGDWVQFGGTIRQIQSLEYDADGKCWFYSELDQSWCSLEQHKPIPLTPEILEKNGFLYKNDHWFWLASKGKVYIQRLANKWFIEVNNELAKKDEFGRADLVSYCRDWAQQLYIHELQHALRLCGIEKEIVL